jgi:Fe-S-cluster-containing dehydrogenase component
MVNPKNPSDLLEQALVSIGWNRNCSRRGFVKGAVGTMAGLAAWHMWGPAGGASPLVIVENAESLIIGDPTRCVGCGRCELACTEFNDGKAAPSMARIQVTRNMHFGPSGALAGRDGDGAFGNSLVVQDTCKQCPHPVPCANACPQDAIQTHPETGARMVITEQCIGCKLCQRVCPWDMMSFDPDTERATKCFLCHGRPKCAEACPAGALKHIPWRDVTGSALPRRSRTPFVAPEKLKSCLDCHAEP